MTASEPQAPPIRIFLAGVALWAALGLEFALLAVLAPEQAKALAAGVGTELAAGREAGVPVGLEQGAHPLLVWQASVTQDLATAFSSYPVFLWLLHRYHDSDRYVMRRLRRIEDAAADHEAYVERWGPIGIAVFMLLPFLVNGPFIGLVVGRLTGIHTRRLILPVVVATIVTAGLWTFFFDGLIRLAGTFLPAAGTWIAGLAVAIVVVLGVIDFVREHRQMAAQASTEEE